MKITDLEYVFGQKLFTQQDVLQHSKLCVIKPAAHNSGVGILWHTHSNVRCYISPWIQAAVPGPLLSLHNTCTTRSIQTIHFIKWWNTKKWLSHQWSLSLTQFQRRDATVSIPLTGRLTHTQSSSSRFIYVGYIVISSLNILTFTYLKF